MLTGFPKILFFLNISGTKTCTLITDDNKPFEFYPNKGINEIVEQTLDFAQTIETHETEKLRPKSPSLLLNTLKKYSLNEYDKNRLNDLEEKCFQNDLVVTFKRMDSFADIYKYSNVVYEHEMTLLKMTKYTTILSEIENTKKALKNEIDYYNEIIDKVLYDRHLYLIFTFHIAHRKMERVFEKQLVKKESEIEKKEYYIELHNYFNMLYQFNNKIAQDYSCNKFLNNLKKYFDLKGRTECLMENLITIIEDRMMFV